MSVDARLLVHSTCRECGHRGSDWLPAMATLDALRCPLCKGTCTDVDAAPRQPPKLTEPERDLVRFLAREALARYAREGKL